MNIYVITNNITNKQYVGKAVDVAARWKQHLKDSKQKVLKSRYLYRSMEKYGAENFSIETIEKNIPEEIINEREIYWISKLSTLAPNGYNLTKGGEGALGRVVTKETRKKMSERALRWHEQNKEKFKEIVKKKTKSPSQASIAKGKETWESNPKNREKVSKMAKEYTASLTKEEFKRKAKKAHETMREKGYNGYAEHFLKMSIEEKEAMYKKISKSNKRCRPILMLDSNGQTLREFHSIGEAARYIESITNSGQKSIKTNIRAVSKTGKIAYGYYWKLK